MTKTKLFSLALIPVIILLTWLLYSSIKSKIDRAEAIKKSEAVIIQKLEIIRESEKAFLSSFGYYTSNWDSLVNFLENDTLYNVEKREIITKRAKNDPLFYTRTDSVRIEYDTLGGTVVKEALFPKEKYPGFDTREMMFIPATDGKSFDIFSGKLKKGGVVIDVIEVIDRYPLDKSRSDENENRKRKFLRFGSRTEVTITGNWE